MINKSNTKTVITKIIIVALAIIVGVAFSTVSLQEVSAAVKKPAKVMKLKAIKKTTGSIKLQWKKQVKVSGVTVKYKVFYKTATGKSWKTKIVKKNTYTIPKLKAGTKYNIKVRAYFKKNGKTYRGKFSKVITAETVADKKPGSIDDYKDALEDAGIPKEKIDDVMEDVQDIAEGYGDSYVAEDVVITDTFTMNGTKIVIGSIEYEGTNVAAEFAVVGDTVYGVIQPDRIVESGTDIINGQEVTFKTGISMEVPNADGTKTFKINDVLVLKWSDGYAAYGVTNEGERYLFNGSYYTLDSGEFINTDTTREHDYTVMSGSWTLSSKGGHCMYVHSNHPDINIYWTCDGTQPKAGQEDLFGSCRYTRNTTRYISVNSVMETPDEAYLKTQLRGTTSYGEEQVIFPENTSYGDEVKFWIKAYAGDKLIYEEFVNINEDGFKEPSPKDYKQECIDRYNELIAYEKATYGAEF